MAKGKGGFIGQDGLNAPDAPTGVSGTAGDKQVTVSFTSPSDVGGSAITGYNVVSSGGGTWKTYYDMANTAYDDVSFSTASQSTTPTALAFNSDGTKMYVGDYNNKVFYQYSLSSAFDVSSASYDSVSFSVTSQVTFLADVTFNNNGTKMYVVGDGNDTVFQYSLSSGFDLSSASYDSVSFNVSSQAASPQGISFNSDGTKMYIVCYTNNAVYQYTLSTGFDLSSASYSSVSFSISSQITQAQGLAFSSDGLKMFVGGNATDTIFEYDLSSAYAISGASYSGNSFSVATQETNPSSFAFNNDGSKLFVVGYTNDAVFQYTAGDFSYPTASPVTITGLTNGTSYTFNVWAINAFGWSVASDASDSVSPKAALGFAAMGSTDNGSSTVYAATVDVINIATTGNATSYGSLGTGRRYPAACSSATRGLVAGGNNGSRLANIQYFTLSTTGGGATFGNLSSSRDELGGLANSTRGLFCGGYRQSGGETSQILYVTIATTGNTSTFGDMAQTGRPRANMSSPTRGIIAGFNNINNIEYVTIATTGNSTDFGDQTQTAYYPAGGSNSTRGLIAGGTDPGINVIQYITIASTGNAADFGDLTQARYKFSGQTSSVRCCWMGGATTSAVNTIDYATIASLGNATDFGDLTLKRESYGAGTIATAHGGLS